MTVLVMLLLGQVHMDLDEVDDDGVLIVLFQLVPALAMTMLVMLLLGQVYMDLDEVDDAGGGNRAIPIGANIGDDHVGNAPARFSVH